MFNITLQPDRPARRGALVAWMQLVRLPNVFTAMADVGMGYLFTHAVIGRRDGWVLGLLVAVSSSLYMAGMALNDVFDFELDARERPERPLPSGRISLAAARRLGWGLLIAGAVFGASASVLTGGVRPGLVAAMLAGCIVLYDAILKPTPLAPLGMGACRTLNVLLGMSAAAGPWQGAHVLAAGAVGVYVAGITWFARTEASRSRRMELLAAMIVILAGIGLLGLLPGQMRDIVPILRQEPGRWPLLLSALGALVAMRLARAVVNPRPVLVQMAVRQSIHSLIVLDAAVAFLAHDLAGAMPILLLLLPTLAAGKWIYST